MLQLCKEEHLLALNNIETYFVWEDQTLTYIFFSLKVMASNRMLDGRTNRIWAQSGAR